MRRFLVDLLLLCSLLAPAFSARAAAFPDRLLFQPLLADPRWPRFSGTMQRNFRRDENLLWAANFGESFPLFGGDDSQFGLQMGVFSRWDVKTQSDDMVNADFLMGFPYSWRNGRFTTMFRIFHVSSHLGDEYMLSHPGVDRLNLSFEAADLRTSYDAGGGFRVYGGGGYLFRRYPTDLKPGTLQAGAEYARAEPVIFHLAPVAALDLQKRQDNGWGMTDVSVRAGFQVTHAALKSRRLLLLLEYYRGHDFNGQWFRRYLESCGAGVHVFF